MYTERKDIGPKGKQPGDTVVICDACGASESRDVCMRSFAILSVCAKIVRPQTKNGPQSVPDGFRVVAENGESAYIDICDGCIESECK